MARDVKKGVSKLINHKRRQLEDIEENRLLEPQQILKVSWEIDRYHLNHEGYLSAEGLSVQIEDLILLNNCGLMVKVAERVLLTGPNGSGKTTLLKCLMGMMKLQSGIVTKSGVKIGYVPQENDQIDLGLTTLEYFHSFGVSESSIEDSELVVGAIMRFCAIPRASIYQKLYALSMGQIARVKFACAILQQPDILLLDEPTNHLDYFSAEHLENQLLQYKGGVLAVSHDRWFIKKFLPTKELRLEGGRLI